MRACWVAIALLASGCFVPGPEHYQRVPAVSGVVLRQGAPIDRAVVWVRPDLDECDAQPTDGVVTGPSGEFALQGLRDFRLGVVVTGGDPGYAYSLCVHPPGEQPLRMMFGGGIGYEAPLSASPLHCDLARTPKTEICQSEGQ